MIIENGFALVFGIIKVCYYQLKKYTNITISNNEEVL